MSRDLSCIHPNAVSAYLNANAWTDSGVLSCSDGVPVFRAWTRGDIEVAVPLRPDFRDYVRRLAEVVETLRRVEQRDAAEVASDLINSACDLVRIRILSTPSHGGSLPLDDAAIYLETARELMVAAASSVISPEPVHLTPQPAQVNDFVRRVQFGALQRGGFSISVPIAAEYDPAAQSTQEPFDRRVTRMLLAGVSNAKEAAAEAVATGSMSGFERAYSQGASANLCAALAGLMGTENAVHDVEIGFSFALVRPAGIPRQQHILQRSFAPVFRLAATELEARALIDGNSTCKAPTPNSSTP